MTARIKKQAGASFSHACDRASCPRPAASRPPHDGTAARGALRPSDAAAVRVRGPAVDPVYTGETDETWVGIAKDPITDPGKKSKEGVLTLVRSKMTKQFYTARIDNGLDEEFEDAMVTVYHLGQFFNITTLAEVRARAAI